MLRSLIAVCSIATAAFGITVVPQAAAAQRPRVAPGAKIYVKCYVVTVAKNGNKRWSRPYIYGPYSSRSEAQSAVDRMNGTGGRNRDGSRWYYSASVFLK
jgi:hypothetical protein